MNEPERADGRAYDALRPVTIEPRPLAYAEGSALISVGNTRVLCAATLEERVPPWLRGQGRGWVTAEYAMLPRATHERTAARSGAREASAAAPTRSSGSSAARLRAVTDLRLLGERSIIVDCDVLQADGGTRTAAITGAYVALALALRRDFTPRNAEVAAGAADRRGQRRVRRRLAHLDLQY